VLFENSEFTVGNGTTVILLEGEELLEHDDFLVADGATVVFSEH